MTNGQLTKMILAAAKTEKSEDILLYKAKALMNRFPLSSEKLLYEQDRTKVPQEAWKILLHAAIETDKEKLEAMNRLLKEVGLRCDKKFGRYKLRK